MNINKAIKKQNKSLRRFVLMMCFIFLLLPLITWKFQMYNFYIILYLIIIEIVIIISIFVKSNNEYLKFEDSKYKLTINNGFLGGRVRLMCDKVVLVHSAEMKKDFQIIIITKSMFRNKKIKPVDIEFLNRYAGLENKYNNIKKQHPQEKYFYLVINKGLLKKYDLLLAIYKSCVYAIFTDEAIRSIQLKIES